MNKTIKIKNLTPHDVVLVNDKGKVVKTFPKCETPLRVSQINEPAGSLEFEGFKIPLTKIKYGEVENLPEKKADIVYIVSALICQACPDRNDFYIPNELVRDKNGKIVGAKSLAINPYYRGDKKWYLPKSISLIEPK